MKSIAFVIDYPDFRGGAHVATHLLIQRLRCDGYTVDVISPDIPSSGIRKALFYITKRSHLGWFPSWMIDPKARIRKRLSLYDTVCCLGEPSISRKLVSELPSFVRKVILIHTYYKDWSNQKHAKEYCRFDKIWYPRYDCIGVIGRKNAETMSELFPLIRNRIVPFHNIIQFQKSFNTSGNPQLKKLVSAIRIGDMAKGAERYLYVAKRLLERGIRFEWIILGDGPQLSDLRLACDEMGLSDNVHLIGYVNNISKYLQEADIFILLSLYEGLPNVIYESMLCGTPVFSTDVGCISEQIKEGGAGWLVKNDDRMIVEKLFSVLEDSQGVVSAKHILKEYLYDNDLAYSEMKVILGVNDDKRNA